MTRVLLTWPPWKWTWTSRFLSRKSSSIVASYATTNGPKTPIVNLIPEKINKSKQALVIKNLHRQNKKLFGELWETKQEKVKIKKMEKVISKTSSDKMVQETVFIALKQTIQGPKAENSSNTIQILPQDKIKMDPTINIKNSGNEKSSEANWMINQSPSSNRVKRLTVHHDEKKKNASDDT